MVNYSVINQLCRSIKKEENCTLEEKNEILEKEYNEFIETLSSNKKE